DMYRNGKANTSIPFSDHSCHADDFAINVAKRAAGVSRINRGVGLDVIRDGITAIADQFAAAFPAHHPIGKGVIEFEWRPNGESKLTDANGITVAQLHDR